MIVKDETSPQAADRPSSAEPLRALTVVEEASKIDELDISVEPEHTLRLGIQL